MLKYAKIALQNKQDLLGGHLGVLRDAMWKLRSMDT